MLPVDAKPTCAEPRHLPLVDQSFGGGASGSRAARRLASLCTMCPVSRECISELAGDKTLLGVWGAGRRDVRQGSSRAAHGTIKVLTDTPDQRSPR